MNIDLELAELCAEYCDDPFGWVMTMFDWGKDELEGQTGPDSWQRDYLMRWGQEIKTRGFDGKTPVLPVRISVSSGHGVGKGHPIDTHYFGKRWGDLKQGDLVFNAAGNLTPVIATRHYQREHFRVSFSDGSSVVVSGEHEWLVKNRNDRRTGADFRVVETNDIINAGVLRSNGVAKAKQWEIPKQQPVVYPDIELPVDPYTYGVWLGDGHKRSGGITNADQEVWDNVAYPHRGYGSARTLYGLQKDLKKSGLFGCTTYNAAVDQRYIESNSRLQLLQGLLDTDGWVEESGGAAFASASKQLTTDVVRIARSLGLVAREPKFKPNKHAGSWQTYITWDGETRLFRIERKQSRLIKAEDRYQKRWIESIESVGLMDGMCIEVEGGLYQTNDFHVTHNSAITAWIILFIMSTRPFCKGIVTANTGDQLRTKTWSELGKWKNLCLVGDWFEYNSGKGSLSLYHRSHSETWRTDALTSEENRSEAFAGLHAAHSSPFYLFDESSAIPSKIWEVAEGGLTDGEPFFFCFGNPTRTDGRFYETQTSAQNWIRLRIDSRTAKMTNKVLLKQWEDEYGKDSDFFRVRVLGEFPRAGDIQFIPSDIVQASRKLGSGQYLGDDALIMGFDVARGGDDECRIQFRRGKDACSEKAYRIPGEKSRDSMVVVSKLTMVIDRHKPDVIFIDATGIGGPIGDRLRQLGYPAVDVHFGGVADDEKKFKNKTAEMGYRCREWLLSGGSIPDSDELEKQLTNREYYHDERDRLTLERKKDMKKRLGYSPDWADALYLTFAQIVPKRVTPRGQLDAIAGIRQNERDYDPLADWR